MRRGDKRCGCGGPERCDVVRDGDRGYGWDCGCQEDVCTERGRHGRERRHSGALALLSYIYGLVIGCWLFVCIV